MEKLKIFLTFDHELPLGGVSSSYADAMFNPTEKVLALAEELDVRVTLFTDILCALRFKEWDDKGFYKPYIEQLKWALTKGHDIQLHLHPHWLTTTYSNGSFSPSEDFALSAFRNKNYPNDIAGIIEKGYSSLQAICSDIKPEYKCIAFRAGGYNIMSASDIIFSELRKRGILFDSSVSKGYYYKSNVQELDFPQKPAAPNWYIGKNGDYTKSAKEGILEIPIATKPKSIFETPTRFKVKKYSNRVPENRGKQIHDEKESGLRHAFKQAFSARMLIFDNYTYSPGYLMKMLDYNVHKYSGFDTIMLSAIGHPKSMGDYSLSLMRSFITDARKKYGNKLEFTTFSNLAKSK